jgi:pyruvate/2-oxoglutarate dehydrogenase complex dihydrolipoamide acyltransferase (E2) component
LRHVDTLSVADTARGIADLADRARSGRLAPDETQAAYMTVTNVGSFGNLTASPIIPLGQVGILGPGLVERRPLPAADNGVRIGWRCLLSLVFDRRAFDDLAADRLLRSAVTELQGIPDTA